MFPLTRVHTIREDGVFSPFGAETDVLLLVRCAEQACEKEDEDEDHPLVQLYGDLPKRTGAPQHVVQLPSETA